MEKVTIEESITTLEDVVKNVKSLPEEEGKAISKLLNLGVDIKYTSRILAAEDVAVLLKRIEAAEDTGALKVVLSNARFKLGTLAEDLKTAGKMDDLLKEFKPLIKEMKLVTLLEEGKDITKVVKALSKVSKVI